MIQRKQTVFLALGALLTGLLYALPLVRYVRAGGGVFELTLAGLIDAEGTRVPDVDLKLPLQVVAGLLIVLLVVVILLFKDRPRQVRLVRFGHILAVGLLVGELFTHLSVRAYLALNSAVESTVLPGAFLPVAVMVCAVLAERGIKADEALVRSMDRLR